MRFRTLTVLIMLFMGTALAHAQQTKAMSIEVFPFELEDKSAGAGIIPPDEHDRRYLFQSAQVAKDVSPSLGVLQ